MLGRFKGIEILYSISIVPLAKTVCSMIAVALESVNAYSPLMTVLSLSDDVI